MLYERILRDVTLFNRSLNQQVVVVRAIFADPAGAVVREVYEHGLGMMTVRVDQVLSLRQVRWMSDESLSDDQRECVSSLVPSQQLEVLRLYLEG